jgi:hypothetical protein
MYAKLNQIGLMLVRMVTALLSYLAGVGQGGLPRKEGLGGWKIGRGGGVVRGRKEEEEEEEEERRRKREEGGREGGESLVERLSPLCSTPTRCMPRPCD